jgi:hypothetical protein
MKNLLPLVFLVFSLVGNGQELIERQWATEFPIGLTRIIRTSSNELYAVYSAYNNQADTSLAVLAKFDENLEPEWWKRYRTLANDDMGTVIELNDGNFLLGGRTSQNFSSFEGGSLTKVDPDGNVLWHKVYDGSGDDRIIHIAERSDGTIVAFNRRGVSNQPVRIMVLDADGFILSQKEYFVSGQGLNVGWVVFDGSAFYVTGNYFNTDLSRNVMFMMYMTPDEVLWSKFYDVGVSISSSSFDINEEGDLFLSAAQADPETVLGGFDIALMRLDADGVPIWSKRIYREGNGLSEFRGGIVPLSEGGFLFSQRHQTDGPLLPVFSRFDGDGNLIWTKAKEGEALSYLYELDNEVILMGGVSASGATVLGTTTADGVFACDQLEAEFDIEDQELTEEELEVTTSPANLGLEEPEITVTELVLESTDLCQATVSVEEFEKEEVRIFPNPTYDRINIELPQATDHLEVRDVTGRIIIRRESLPKKVSLDMGMFPRGAYTIHSNSGFLGRVVKL